MNLPRKPNELIITIDTILNLLDPPTAATIRKAWEETEPRMRDTLARLIELAYVQGMQDSASHIQWMMADSLDKAKKISARGYSITSTK